MYLNAFENNFYLDEKRNINRTAAIKYTPLQDSSFNIREIN